MNFTLFDCSNPIGGNREGALIYSKIVKPMLEQSGIDVDLIETKYTGHAKEISKNFDSVKYKALLVVSGDGTFHEVVNGLALAV